MERLRNSPLQSGIHKSLSHWHSVLTTLTTLRHADITHIILPPHLLHSSYNNHNFDKLNMPPGAAAMHTNALYAHFHHQQQMKLKEVQQQQQAPLHATPPVGGATAGNFVGGPSQTLAPLTASTSDTKDISVGQQEATESANNTDIETGPPGTV